MKSVGAEMVGYLNREVDRVRSNLLERIDELQRRLAKAKERIEKAKVKPTGEHCGADMMGEVGFVGLEIDRSCSTLQSLWDCRRFVMADLVYREKDPRYVLRSDEAVPEQGGAT